MRVFIAHAEADQAVADELKETLQRQALMAETESGERGFRFLSPTDVVVMLWSQAATFSPRRLGLEKRMLDAWADARLVLVKLDHNFLPVGVRDLPAIDATFAAMRATTAWHHVSRAVREIRDNAMRDQAAAPPPAPSMGSTGGGGPGGQGGEGDSERQERSRDARAAPPPPQSAPMPKRSARMKRAARGGPAVLGHLLAILAVAVGGAILIYLDLPYAVPIVIVAAALTFLVPLWLFLRPRTKDRPMAAMRAPAPEAAREDAKASEVTMGGAPAAPAGQMLFISYAHADNAEVAPVVRLVEANGREVWIDKGGIQAGEGWAGEIVRAIKSAKGVMVMCSKKAFESDHIKREVYLADRYKKPMLPVFIEEAAPPEDFEYFFASVQWLELFKLPEADRAGAMAKALAAV